MQRVYIHINVTQIFIPDVAGMFNPSSQRLPVAPPGTDHDFLAQTPGASKLRDSPECAKRFSQAVSFPAQLQPPSEGFTACNYPQQELPSAREPLLILVCPCAENQFIIRWTGAVKFQLQVQ